MSNLVKGLRSIYVGEDGRVSAIKKMAVMELLSLPTPPRAIVDIAYGSTAERLCAAALSRVGVRESICDMIFLNPSARQNWRYPLDSHGDPEMVAYDLLTPEGEKKAQMMRLGRLLVKTFGDTPRRKKIAEYLGSVLTPRWAAAAPKTEQYRLVVSDAPEAFEWAYSDWGMGSCMAHQPHADSMEEQGTCENPHAQYYYEVVNRRHNNVSVALLYGEGGETELLARALVWRVQTPAGEILYGDRQYAVCHDRSFLQEVLHRKLFEYGCRWVKKLGADAFNPTAIVDAEDNLIPYSEVKEWRVDGVEIYDGDPIAWGDTMKFYCGRELRPVADELTAFDMQTQDEYMHEKVCACCGCRVDTDEAHWYDDEPYCDDCFNEHFEECSDCGDIFPRDGMLYVEDERYVCRSCADDYAPCENCGEYYRVEYMDEIDGRLFCGGCTDRVAWPCAHCGELHIEQHMHTIMEDGEKVGDLCDHCYNAYLDAREAREAEVELTAV